MRYPHRRSKIVCTLGPAVAGPENLKKLIETGLDVARLNFSHGSHEAHKKTIHELRAASKQLNVPVAILVDLQGPKIRTGKIKNGQPDGGGKICMPLKPQQKLWFEGTDISNPKIGDGSPDLPLSISYPRLASDLKAGDKILFDDGLVSMTVESTDPVRGRVLAIVQHGNNLGENKGVNFPGAKLSTLGITEKDWEDILFAVQEDVDFFALSFVRTAREVRHLKEFLKQKNKNCGVIAKIEMGAALDNIDEILQHSDGIMVARGDLALEIGNENVAIAQKHLIAKARQAGKPVITATQMLMSMVDNPSPTRAEASDIANAVLDGSDALMLSNETATGRYPFEAVQTMSQIILGAEGLSARDLWRDVGVNTARGTQQRMGASEAIEVSASAMAAQVGARCVACLTRSGQAARLVAKYRPTAPIYAFAENERVRNQLCLSWGVSVVPWKEIVHQDYTVFDDLLSALGRLGLIQEGDLAVMTAGIPTSMQMGTTNTVVIRSYPPPHRKI